MMEGVICTCHSFRFRSSSLQRSGQDLTVTHLQTRYDAISQGQSSEVRTGVYTGGLALRCTHSFRKRGWKTSKEVMPYFRLDILRTYTVGVAS